MSEDIEDKARILYKLLTMSVRRIQADKPMKQHEIALLRRIFPDTYSLCAEMSFEEIIEIDKKYIDHPVYAERLRIMLSPEGQKWLKGSLDLIKSHEARNK